jgi:peptidoglycan/xylan/chitin deacetylase (PgdA/CDA1 family)
MPGEQPYHDPALIRRIHAAGHEIGSHAHYHEWLPALDRLALRETLWKSKQSLEECIGAPVVTFVPPFNQPFDYIGGFSVSLSERREAPHHRTDLAALCAALCETGYRFARVAYRPMLQRLRERVLGRRLDRPARIERIGDLACVRLNTPGGFAEPARAMIERVALEGGVAVVYGHPHSLHAPGWQNEEQLVPFLRRIGDLRRSSGLRVALPRELVGDGPAR